MKQCYRALLLVVLPALSRGELNARIQQQILPELRVVLFATLAINADRGGSLIYNGATPAVGLSPTRPAFLIAVQIDTMSDLIMSDETLTMAAQEAEARLAPVVRAAFGNSAAIQALKVDHCAPVPTLVPARAWSAVAPQTLTAFMTLLDPTWPDTFGRRRLHPIELAWYTFLVISVFLRPER